MCRANLFAHSVTIVHAGRWLIINPADRSPSLRVVADRRFANAVVSIGVTRIGEGYHLKVNLAAAGKNVKLAVDVDGYRCSDALRLALDYNAPVFDPGNCAVGVVSGIGASALLVGSFKALPEARFPEPSRKYVFGKTEELKRILDELYLNYAIK